MGNKFVDFKAGKYAEEADAFSIHRDYFNRTERTIKSVVRRMVAINEHCMKHFNYEKQKKTKTERLSASKK